jgi:hypothetical protein
MASLLLTTPVTTQWKVAGVDPLRDCVAKRGGAFGVTASIDADHDVTNANHCWRPSSAFLGVIGAHTPHAMLGCQRSNTSVNVTLARRGVNQPLTVNVRIIELTQIQRDVAS